ncbi:MAG TPA: hypothetical protein VFS20_05665, partial [Longimicrobium sp.]|nr:hypothetical protein [Longimicrobium sp.]
MSTFTNFSTADQLYRYRRDVVAISHSCDDPTLKKTCFALRKFENEVASVGAAETWIEGIRVLRRIRSAALSLPLPFDHPSVCPHNIVEQLARWARIGTSADPARGSAASELVELVNVLSNSLAQPLADLVLDCILAVGTYPTAIVIPNSARREAVQAFWAGLWDPDAVHVVAPAQLRGLPSFQHAVIVGPVRWFPDHVF